MLRQTASYAAAACGDRWIAVRREPGWETGAALDPAVLTTIVDQLQRQVNATRACVAAGLTLVPSATTAAHAEAYCDLLQGKIAHINDLIASDRHAAAIADRAAAERKVARLTTADWGRLSKAERERFEQALGLELPAEEPSAGDALGRRTVTFDDRVRTRRAT